IEDIKNDREATKLLSTLKSELKKNKELLDNWTPYHQGIIKDVDSLLKDDLFVDAFIKDPSAIYPIFTKGTLMAETPSADTWDIAKSHPLIVNFEYDELLALSRIYNQQENTYSVLPKLIDLMLSPDFNDKEKARSNLQSFKNMMQDITGREIQLITYYNEADALLKYQDAKKTN
ncbi:MAG: hypothetical protein WBH03_18970, partial [Cyclobacteriaceae bacterium]